MVFSFFKKKDNEPEEALPKQPRIVQPKPPQQAAEPAAKPAADAPQPKADLPSLDFATIGPSSISSARIDVVETSDLLSPAMEQAAICFANDQVDDAIAILADDLDTADGHGLDTWLMLFDLYQMRGRRADFDELALRFVVRFERSAPVWQETGKSSKPGAAAPAKAGGPYFLFQPKLNGEAIEAMLDQLEKLVLDGAPVRVDFGRVEEVEPAAATAIVCRWAKFKKKKAKFQPAGGPALADKLRGKIEVMRRAEDEGPYWLLLLEIYQMLGLQEDFENLAVDYAVTFEVSPPSWDATAKTKTAKEVADEEAKLRAEAPIAEPEKDAYVFDGAIVNATDAMLQPLVTYAATHAEVRIDFSKVPRVDFVSAGMLMNVLVAITAQSKQAVIIGANELIVALFRIMGISEVSTIVRKK
ncbi:MAG: STAS domain-containing protein [Burkholderiales bacterium]|nr:STAS domain-containing protein [Burkholderiales bacterium]